MAQSNADVTYQPPAPLRYRLALPALVRGLLPPLLRKPRLLALLAALTQPVAVCYLAFLAYARTVRTELSFSGQTLAFERALNVRFDPVLRRIRILNVDAQVETTYLHFEVEAQPPVFRGFSSEAPPWVYNYDWGEINNAVGFIVRVPVELRPRQDALNTRIRHFKLALIKYRIQYF